MKKYVLLTSGILLSLIFAIACNNSKDDDQNPEPTQESEPQTLYEANLNPTDPNLMDITTPEGDKFYLLGEKDENGMPTALNAIFMQQDGVEEMAEMWFDENRRIKEFITENGVRMTLEWLNDTQAALTLIEPETGEQLNTVVILDNNNNSSISKSAKRKVKQAPRSGDVQLSVYPRTTRKPTAKTVKQNASSGGRTGLVRLYGCSSSIPTDGSVYVKLYRASDSEFMSNQYLTTIYCKRLETGVYQYTIPSSEFKEVKLSDYCDQIAELAMAFCDADMAQSPNSVLSFAEREAICASITAGLAAGVVTAPAAAAFAGICTALNAFATSYCFANQATGMDGFRDIICPQIKAMDKTVYESKILVVPAVVTLGKHDIKGTIGVFTASQPILDLIISTGGEPSINEFSLDPSAPLHGVSYMATAYLSCLPKGTYITMHIDGTDDYHKTVNYTIETDELNYVATMSVPGAICSGVRDVVTVTADIPSGGSIKKTASLIFQ